MSLLPRSAYRRQLLPSVGVAVSMTAEAESSIKLAYVHGESETVSTTGRVSVGLVWCRGKETRAKSTRRTRDGVGQLVGPCIYLLLRVGAPVCGELGLHASA